MLSRLIANSKFTYALIFIFFLVYAFGSTSNSSLDAWAYADQVLKGKDLFQPHHLLYSSLGYMWVSTVSAFCSINPMTLLKLMNAIFAAGILLVLSTVLKSINLDDSLNAVLLIFAGASWGFMRFATENETYIVPIFFSLLGTYFFIRTDIQKNVLWAGLFAVIAILFHQVMVFWWIGLLAGVVYSRSFTKMILYGVPALIVPLVYAVVVYHVYGMLSFDLLIRFVFSDYYSGAAGVDVGVKSLLLLCISIFRSFVQVHGYIINLGYLAWILGLLSFVLIGYGFFRIVANIKLLKINYSSIFWIVSLILFMQIGFAGLSDGNAEFMVMVPILVTILLSSVSNIGVVSIGLIGAGLFIWNLTFGIVPLKFYKLDGSEMVVNHIMSSKEKSVYLLYSKPRIENELSYRGVRNDVILIKYNRQGVLISDSIRNLISRGYYVYTDIYNRPITMSRETLVADMDSIQKILDNYKKVPIDSMSTMTGKYYLFQLK